mgnify:CR=1 FL=1
MLQYLFLNLLSFFLVADHAHSHNIDLSQLLPDFIPLLFFLPALSLFFGHKPAQELICFSVLNTSILVPISAIILEADILLIPGIVSNNSIRIAGDDLTADIQEYMSRQHNVKVSERMAERIKINVGAALTELGEDAPEDYIVHGPNRITALPMEVPVCYQEVAHCLEKSISKIETAILSALENTPPELYADIVHNGIYLAGGGALLRGLDKRLTDKINIPFHIAEDPLHAVAKGTGVALKNVDRFSFLMR